MTLTCKWFWIVIMAGSLLSSAVESAFSQQSQAPDLFAANEVREALKEKNVAPEMSVIPRTSTELRSVISHHLDSRLLNQNRSIAGRDFRYQFSDTNRTEQLGVIVLRYPTAVKAKNMSAILGQGQKYFRKSKILIRFSAAALDKLLVVSYSENSGDRRMVEVIDDLPARFDKASSARGIVWNDAVMPSPK